MAEPKVLVEGEGRRRGSMPTSTAQAWRWVGWFGVVLAVVGFGDFALAWYPTSFGIPEWEFATVAQTFAGLPLITMGLAGVLGAGLALGKRAIVVLMGGFLVLWSLVLLAALALFLTDVPLAMRAAEGVAAVGIKKAVVKTLLIGVVFIAGYVAAAFAAFRSASRRGGTT